MTTVITHFFNEERMLQWWLPHHLQYFENGILINHSSTDRSVDVCRDLAPNWKVVNSQLETFDAINNDFEVMQYEASVNGWKMALNVTEFLICPGFEKKLGDFEGEDKWGFRTQGVIMVDEKPDVSPLVQEPLVNQKRYGFIEEKKRFRFSKHEGYGQLTLNGVRVKRPHRQRLVHRYLTGAYTPGRHSSHRNAEGPQHGAFVLWYGFCPWDKTARDRKLQFAARIPKTDRSVGMGTQHLMSKHQFDNDYTANLKLARDLSRIIIPPEDFVA